MGLRMNFSRVQQCNNNQYQMKMKKQITKLSKKFQHSKKNKLNNIQTNTTAEQNEQKNKIQINTISKQILASTDLQTDLTPAELIQIILNPSHEFQVERINDYSYQLQKTISTLDFVYDEEAEDLIPCYTNEILLFSFEVLQIKETQNKYTLIFKNLNKSLPFQFNNIVSELHRIILSQ